MDPIQTSVWLFMCMCIWLGCQAQAIAQSPAAATATSTASQRFASVLRIRGNVNALDPRNGQSRVLREGDQVLVGEQVKADSTGEALFRTDDAGFVALRPGGVFVAETYSAQGNASDNMTLRVVVGALRIVTGWIGSTNRAGARVLTPTATIGIRGTDHEPFVMSAELSEQTLQPEGTYDKVNRGGTTLDTRGGQLELEPGKVGFVRTSRTRGLLTLIVPVLLDKVPDFFVPGQFEAELDALSARADVDALQELDKRRANPPTDASQSSPAAVLRPSLASPPVAAPGARPSADTATGFAVSAGVCSPQVISRGWLRVFDAAVVRRDASAVEVLFAPEAVVRVKVLVKDGATSEFDVGRDALVKSAMTALDSLTDYSQRRPMIEGRSDGGVACERVAVTSLVIEQGRQNGQPYRFEALETYMLVQRAGRWVAVSASTTQR